jgi:hypothetical protein
VRREQFFQQTLPFVRPVHLLLPMKKILARKLPALFLLLPALALPARFGAPGRSYDPEKKIAVKYLREDVQLLRSALIEAHGAIDRYTPLPELERKFAAALERIGRSMSEREFYLLLAPLVTAIRCGHTTIHPSYAWREAMRKKMPLFPFKLKFIDGVACAQRNYSRFENLELGGEITSINGVPMKEIVARMLALIPADADIQNSKLSKLESTNYFGTWYNLIFGKTAEYVTVIRSLDGTAARSVRSAGIRAGDLQAMFSRRYPAAASFSAAAPIKLEYKTRGALVIAVLTIYTFNVGAYNEAGLDYPVFLADAFKEIRKRSIGRLLIDLRGNYGGDNVFGKILAAYLMDAPFQYYRSLEVKRLNLSFWKFTNRPDSVRKLAGLVKLNSRGTYDVIDHPNLGWLQPSSPSFKGKVFILLNGGSFSTSGECASVLHYHQRARFIGSECGAGYFGNTSGLGLMLTLPHSGIRVGIPLCKVTMAVSGQDPYRGIRPDYPFQPSPADVLLETDSELAFAIKVILQEAQSE